MEAADAADNYRASEAVHATTGGTLPKKLSTTNPDTTQKIVLDPSQLTAMIAQAAAQVVQQMGTTQPGFAVHHVASAPSFLGGQRSAQAMGMSWADYCRDEDQWDDAPHLFGRTPMSQGTWEQAVRILAQLQAEGIPLDPPDADAFYDWACKHPKGRQSLDSHRKFLCWKLDYWGIPIPPQLKKQWGTEKAKAKAVREGRRAVFKKHFENGPWDILRLTNANVWQRGPGAELVNLEFRHAVTLQALGGGRSAEGWYLRVQDLDPTRKEIRNWWQRKKSATRTVDIPEDWFWTGVGMSHWKFTNDTRQRLLALSGEKTDSYFLSGHGTPYKTDKAFRNSFIKKGIEGTLGYRIGGHAFRRFCATVRYGWGWTIEEVADHLDDEVDTVRNHYIDKTLSRMIRKRAPRRRDDEEPPALPPLWNLVKHCGLPKPGEARITDEAPDIPDDPEDDEPEAPEEK